MKSIERQLRSRGADLVASDLRRRLSVPDAIGVAGIVDFRRMTALTSSHAARSPPAEPVKRVGWWDSWD